MNTPRVFWHLVHLLYFINFPRYDIIYKLRSLFNEIDYHIYIGGLMHAY